MKKFILLLFVGMFLIYGVFAEDCNIARPYFGSVNCEEVDGWSDPIFLEDNQLWTCDVPTCDIIGMNVDDFTCSGWGTTSILTIIKNGEAEWLCSNFGEGSLNAKCEDEGVYDISLHKGDNIQIDFSCNLGEPEDNPQLEVRYKPIKLKLYFDSGQGFLSDTEFCNSNDFYDDYKDKQLLDNDELNSLEISDEIIGSDENDALSMVPSGDTLVPKQMSIDENYWFIYDWVERPSLIVSSFEKKDVWCNPLDHSLTELEQVNTRGTDCYLIPTTKLSTKVSCCSSDECKGQYKNQEIFCDDDFKCGFEKSCLSDSDCGASERCQEDSGIYFLVNSYCDKNELDEYNKGSCKTDKQEVLCCNGNDGGPSVCTSGEYCDYNEGCKEVTYETSKGKLKTGVGGVDLEKDKTNKISGAIGGLPGESSSSGKTIFIILLIGLVAVAGIYYKKNKNQESKKNSGEKIEEIKKCKNCNAILKSNSKFCIGCGEKI